MTYNGIEIFMMNIGNADCFLVKHYSPSGVIETVLVDGGNKSNEKFIANRLRDLGISHINHVVNTHPHDDHAGGLVELIANSSFSFDKIWMHQAWRYIDSQSIRKQLGRNSAKWVSERFEASLLTQIELCKASSDRGIVLSEPFAGARIGPFTVLGPTPEFYKDCLLHFGNVDKVRQWNQYLQSQSEKKTVKSIFEEILLEESQLGGVTSPENESSVIMVARHENKKLLFCGDAGCDAFSDIINRNFAEHLRDVTWMHSPHHGSRRNLGPEFVSYLNPETVFISCKGSRKHPSRKLVNTFKKKCGASVYGSYYPKPSGSMWLRQSYGTVPERDTTPATALYDAGERRY